MGVSRGKITLIVIDGMATARHGKIRCGVNPAVRDLSGVRFYHHLSYFVVVPLV